MSVVFWSLLLLLICDIVGMVTSLESPHHFVKKCYDKVVLSNRTTLPLRRSVRCSLPRKYTNNNFDIVFGTFWYGIDTLDDLKLSNARVENATCLTLT